jgi:hypothetical protein
MSPTRHRTPRIRYVHVPVAQPVHLPVHTPYTQCAAVHSCTRQWGNVSHLDIFLRSVTLCVAVRGCAPQLIRSLAGRHEILGSVPTAAPQPRSHQCSSRAPGVFCAALVSALVSAPLSAFFPRSYPRFFGVQWGAVAYSGVQNWQYSAIFCAKSVPNWHELGKLLH